MLTTSSNKSAMLIYTSKPVGGNTNWKDTFLRAISSMYQKYFFKYHTFFNPVILPRAVYSEEIIIGNQKCV